MANESIKSTANLKQFTDLLSSFDNPAWTAVSDRLYRACGGSVKSGEGVSFGVYKNVIEVLALGSDLQRAQVIFGIYDEKGRGAFNIDEARSVYEAFFMASKPVAKLLGLGDTEENIRSRLRPHMDKALLQMFADLDPEGSGEIDLEAFSDGFQKGKVLPMFTGNNE